MNLNPIESIMNNISIIQQRRLLFTGIPYFAVNEKVIFGSKIYNVISSSFNQDIGWTYNIKDDSTQYNNIREIFLKTANRNHKFKFKVDIPLRLKKYPNIKGTLSHVTYDYSTKSFINMLLDGNEKIVIYDSRNYFFDDELEINTEGLHSLGNLDKLKSEFNKDNFIHKYKKDNPSRLIPETDPEFRIGNYVFLNYSGNYMISKIDDIDIKDGNWIYRIIQPKFDAIKYFSEKELISI
ncbi:hypothetical protein QKU48_gp0667 [Fadolivirus algeromassiliense]|jgi:hypothetical protein|uniref:Uncharacterized protein n=1 Tax=Fadolivirus FV1/VV64 TaxID=3070911 RepID=A0A7D3QUH0_9VIRU|nr:hypothetical protein QKU48_gp0667 [Fadolivirus algeromassiliense]QKF94125.1 hypothetical protein Fadolivirus_1_667 [Fadolivirus FV1/VV64]